MLPVESTTTPPFGFPPSAPPVKLYIVVSLWEVSNLNTVPYPNSPPSMVVP